MLSFSQALDLIPRPTKRPALQVTCEECRGHGEICHGHHMDPDARVSTCEPCAGTGEVDAACHVCGEPSVTAIRYPGERGDTYLCEACERGATSLDDDERALVVDFEVHHEVELRQIFLDYSDALNAASLAATKLSQAVRT
jgi:RecJ-like exonuclease